MTEEGIAFYLVYLASWRLSVVGTGALCIYLGFRLFALGLEAGKSDMEVEHGGSIVRLRNIAPGTAFALFGAVLIGSMVVSAPPEVVRKGSGEGFELLLRGDRDTPPIPPEADTSGDREDPVMDRIYE